MGVLLGGTQAYRAFAWKRKTYTRRRELLGPLGVAVVVEQSSVLVGAGQDMHTTFSLVVRILE